MNRLGRLGVAAGTGLTLVGGVVLERRLRRGREDGMPDTDGQRLGMLRGQVHEVVADDGVVLHAEVDELSPYGTAADHERADAGVTMVFVHGFALTLDSWHFQRLAFRGKRRLVFYDQRSHGRSGLSDQKHATIEQLGRDLRSVIDALAPDDRVVLVGHSMGGMSLVALAELYPELFGDRVVGVALISTTAGGAQTHKIVSRLIPDAIGRRAVERGLVVAAHRERLFELARRSGSAVSRWLVQAYSFGSHPVPASYVEFVDSMIAATPLKVLVEFIPQFDLLDKFHVVEAFAVVPTWVICGTDDRMISVAHARKLNEKIPDSYLVELAGAGHVPILDFAAEVNRALEDLVMVAETRLQGGLEGPAQGSAGRHTGGGR